MGISGSVRYTDQAGRKSYRKTDACFQKQFYKKVIKESTLLIKQWKNRAAMSLVEYLGLSEK